MSTVSKRSYREEKIKQPKRNGHLGLQRTNDFFINKLPTVHYSSLYNCRSKAHIILMKMIVNGCLIISFFFIVIHFSCIFFLILNNNKFYFKFLFVIEKR